jgi:serine/threonine-protein kinase HipA
MNLTLEIHWDNVWRTAGQVRFMHPDQGLYGQPGFYYHAGYTIEALESSGNLNQTNLIDHRAASVNLPCHFGGDYHSGQVAPVLRDIIPQGAGRRFWARQLGYSKDLGQSLDTTLLQEGCIAPIGNLRIKEAAEQFNERVDHQGVSLFSREEVIEKADSLIEYAQALGIALGGATGAGGDAPKLLLAENFDGKFALEGTLADEQIAKHWLVKFPRGRKSLNDIAVLEGESAVYQALEMRGFNTIKGARIDNAGKHTTLWLPRFDREITGQGIVHHGVESVYSVMGLIGDGASLDHVDIISRLQAIIQHPDGPDALLADYLVRDILNTVIGNRDNHGRNMAIIKDGGAIKLAPAYDLAPMALDPEGIARTTHWPRNLRGDGLNANYTKVIQVLANDVFAATSYLVRKLEELSGWQGRLQELGAPELMLNHPGVRLNYLDQVLDELEKHL